MKSKQEIQQGYNPQDFENYVESFMQKHDIVLGPQYSEVFDNHLKSLIDRIVNNNCAKLNDLSAAQEVSDKNKDLAKELLAPWFTKYGVDRNVVEETLLAIYFEISSKEGKENG